MIHVDGTRFVDEHGRTLLLRGVNLGGSSKVPVKPNGATHLQEGFFDHRNVSFVGQPFPLEEADEHFARLRAWGFTFVRFLVTWEAIEHIGPGLYDEAYLAYVRQVIEKAAAHDISVFVDPHQDVWSRYSGGDGAPGWTFEILGMDITRFAETGAALLHQVNGDPMPHLIWSTNSGKLAAATLFTLFFAGNDFASATLIDGVPAQEYLQRHYIDAVKQLAQHLKGLPNVVGYEVMNEPQRGYIGLADVRQQATPAFHRGWSPTAYQGMLLGAGIPQEVGVWRIGPLGSWRAGRRLINPRGISLWRAGHKPIWQQNGVWTIDSPGQPRLLQPDHFSQVGGRPVDFYGDYFKPFAGRFAQEIRAVHPGALIFVEGLYGEPMTWSGNDIPGIVHAPHWYDIIPLVARGFLPWIVFDPRRRRLVLGGKRAARSRVEQIGQLVGESRELMGGVPTLIGETGIPLDMKGKRAYRTGDFSLQVRALDATMRALEANLASFTLWNYTANNDNRRGDQWNGEDFSLFSRDQQTGSGEIIDGGRALEAAVRPYAARVAGEPLSMAFDIKSRVFEFRFRNDPQIEAPTEIFVPDFQYPQGYQVSVSGGTYEADGEMQCLRYFAPPDLGEPVIRISPAL